MTDTSNKRDVGIDLLRCFSVLLVVFNHYSPSTSLFISGTHGVVIFFMVSGLCMYYSMKHRTGWAFLLARFWRLAPTLILCATITHMVESLVSDQIPERGQSFTQYVANIICLPLGNLVCDGVSDLLTGAPSSFNWVDGVYWSLLVEIRFYLLLWLVCYLLKFKYPAFLLATLGLLAPLNLEWSMISKSKDFLGYLPFFAFGLALGDTRKNRTIGVLGMGYSFLVFLVSGYFGFDSLSMNLNQQNILGYAACFLIFWCSISIFRNRFNRVISYFGVLSYPIYLLHQDIGLIFLSMLDSLPFYISFLLVFILILFVSAGVNRIVEKYQPLLIFKKVGIVKDKAPRNMS